MKLTVDRKVWVNLKKEFVKAESLQTEVGWDGTSYGPSNDNLSHAQVARWQDEGVPLQNIPPRPFFKVGFRDALLDGKNADSFKRIVSAVANGQDTFKAMYREGDSFRQTLRQVMLDWDTPPNAALTVELKGFDDPLIETSELVSNVSAKVVRKTGGD